MAENIKIEKKPKKTLTAKVNDEAFASFKLACTKKGITMPLALEGLMRFFAENEFAILLMPDDKVELTLIEGVEKYDKI